VAQAGRAAAAGAGPGVASRLTPTAAADAVTLHRLVVANPQC
jgi:hypothetical protein